MDRGRRLREVLKQPQFSPVPIENQIIVIYATTHGYSDEISLDRMAEWENELVRFMESSQPDLIKALLAEKELTEKIEKQLKAALESFSF
ncbi:MAG: hypothetical protein GQ562_04810 [Anaerolineales bacterium]|nr:hypothetical protein [Anaerolineales bacterium]